MIKYTQGNLLEAPTEALVNTVNTVGVMGKGIALQFKEAFPENFRIYEKACREKMLEPGKLLLVREITSSGEKWIVNFPTKTVYYRKSSYKFVEAGLKALVEELQKNNIKSIAVPPLGCGNGGLQWSKVKTLIEDYLGRLEVDVLVYEPNDSIKIQLQKKESKGSKLTPARAMLLFALFQYERLGEDASLFVANKLAYFLQRMGENLRLNFVAHYYGPYSNQVEHVLYHLNGKYLKGMEQMNVKPFEPLKLNYAFYEEVRLYLKSSLKSEQLNRLNKLLEFIEGFESAFSLELLASVDYLLQEDSKATVEDLMPKIKEWSSRKTRMFQPDYVNIAYNHLNAYKVNPF